MVNENSPFKYRAVERSHRGGVVLGLAIIGIAFFPFAVLAWLMGHADLREIDEGRMDECGKTLTNAGRLIGMTVTICVIVFLIGGVSLRLLF